MTQLPLSTPRGQYLQYKDFADDLTKIQNGFGVKVHNFDDLVHYDDLDDVVALSAALDIVVSTKITAPLITAAAGTLTKLANCPQSPSNNISLNPAGPSLDIFKRNTWEPWSNVFRAIAEDIAKLNKNNNCLGKYSKMNEIVNVFLPMRVESERIPNKNRKTFAKIKGGHCKIKLEQPVTCDLVEKIFVSTDEPDVIEISNGVNSKKLRLLFNLVN